MKTLTPYLLFTLNKEFFGIRVINVLRVINLENLMKVPNAPHYIAGAISVEGNVIPVIDLGTKIELGSTTITNRTKVIILHVHHEEETIEVGVMIDNVIDVVSIDETTLIAPALERMGFDTSTLDGMYKQEETFYMLLNPNKVFEKELATLV